MHGTLPGAHRRGRPRMAWMDNIKTWTRLSLEESIRMTEINGESTSTVWPTRGSRTAKEQNSRVNISTAGVSCIRRQGRLGELWVIAAASTRDGCVWLARYDFLSVFYRTLQIQPDQFPRDFPETSTIHFSKKIPADFHATSHKISIWRWSL